MAIKFKSSGTKITDPVIARIDIPQVPVGIKTPMRLGTDRSGILSMNFSSADQIKDNLRNLLLTNSGERLGRFNFGANLRRLVAEVSAEDLESQAITQIQSAVSTYMPYVSLQNFSVTYDSASAPTGMTVVNFNILYSIPSLGSNNNTLTVKVYAIG